MPKPPRSASSIIVEWSPEALKQVAKIKNWPDARKAQAYLGKIKDLLNDACEHPFTGLGKPEPLKYKVPPCWSRRITHADRLVYRIKAGKIQVVSLLGHYT